MPKVSVIVPVYNVEKYIEKCLESLVNQTLEDIEIIIVNDGSTDNSKKIIEKYLKNKKVVYLEKSNGGLSSARNYGIPYAKGEYIGFIDSDDYIEKTMFEKMYNKAIEEKSDMVECDFLWEYPNKIKIDTGKIYSTKKSAIIDARVVAWNKLIKKEILEEIKIQFPEGLRYEDVEFFYKLIPYLNKIAFIKEPLIHYVQRTTSIANTQNEKTSEIFQVLDNVIEFYKANNFYNIYEEELEYIYTRFLLCSSLRRMTKIKNKSIKKELLKRTWENLNIKFPDWKKNKYLKNEKTMKNLYIRTVNNFTYKIYIKLFSFI